MSVAAARIRPVRKRSFFDEFLRLIRQKKICREFAKRSAVTKNTLKRYIDYLEAAVLVRVITRVDRKAGCFQRNPQYRNYLTRTGLFEPLVEGSDGLGHLMETAIFAQRFHRRRAPALPEMEKRQPYPRTGFHLTHRRTGSRGGGQNQIQRPARPTSCHQGAVAGLFLGKQYPTPDHHHSHT